MGVTGVCLNYLFAIVYHNIGCLIMNEWVALNNGTPGTTPKAIIGQQPLLFFVLSENLERNIAGSGAKQDSYAFGLRNYPYKLFRVEWGACIPHSLRRST